MLTVPTALWPYLLSGSWRPAIVFEVEAFAGRSTLYYGFRDVTWNSNSYVGLALRWKPSVQQMEFRVPSCSVTFANAANTLRGYLTPTDTLTGARLTVRMLAFDSSWNVLTDSLVLFRGVIEPPRRITESEFEIVATGLLDGAGADCPARRMALTCPWPFANSGAFDGGGHCSYQSNALASGSGASSTALTLPSTTAVGAGVNSKALTLAAANGFANLAFIKIGSGDPVTILAGGGTTSLTLAFARSWSSGDTVVAYFANGSTIQIGAGSAVSVSSGGGTASLTLAAARTWSNGATIRHSDCPGRTRGECEARGMLHRFGGHPAVAATSRLLQLEVGGSTGRHSAPPANRRGGGGVRYIDRTLGGDAGDKYAVPADPVPVLYGRRRITPRIIEKVVALNPSSAKLQQVSLHLVGNGKLSAVKGWYLGGRSGVEYFGLTADKQRGTYVRLGDPGAADAETQAEYVSDQTTIVRSQNVDYRSFAVVAYSEEGYVVFVQDSSVAVDPTMFELDVEGSVLQRYNSDGSPNGARAYDVSPIWECVDFATSDVFGMRLLSTDIDMAASKPEADYGSELISANEANTTVTVAQGSATTRCYVKSTEGFILGRRVDVNGSSNTVAGIASATELTLGSAVTQSVGHTVVQRPQRFEGHAYLGMIQKGTRWLKSMLDACRGYVTYDSGKIQFRIERDTCKERMADGGMETWSSSTNLTSWTENLGSGEATVNRDSSTIHGGAYSCRIDRSGNTQFAGITQGITGLEPGRWYRIVFWHRQSTGSMGNACRLRILNTTRTKYLTSDGYTWQSGTADAISQGGFTTWSPFEIVFKVDEGFASTDTIEFAFAPYFSAGQSVWYDDASLRGPYGGAFSEYVDARFMGMQEGSFAWDLDRKDRETNQVRVQFFNESGFFGDDEAVANDFSHQASHAVKSIDWDGTFVCDRDQAGRLATWRLAKARTLGTGCEFVAAPAALALQPGDVILVTHTVPNWESKEQRVTSVELIGGPEDYELFVKVTTEDYLESIYSDIGPSQLVLPPQTTPTLTASVTRNAGGVLDLAFTLSDPTVSVVRYEVHLSDTSGFTPDAVTLIGTSTATTFRWQARVDDLDVVRYVVVNAITERGVFASPEFSTTIFRADSVASGYSANYQYPTTIQSVDPTAGFTAYVNESGGAATVAKINDASDSTYLKGSSSATAGTSNNDDGSIRYHSFGAGTHTGRPYIRGRRVATGSGVSANLETVKYYYTLDRTAGSITWVLWQTVTSSSIQDYFGPEITADYTKLAFRCIVESPTSGSSTRSCDDYNYRVAFDQKA